MQDSHSARRDADVALDREISALAKKEGIGYTQAWERIKQQKAAAANVLPFRTEADILRRVREIAAEVRSTPKAAAKPSAAGSVSGRLSPQSAKVAAAVAEMARRALHLGGETLTKADHDARDIVHAERLRRDEMSGGPFGDFLVAQRAVRARKDFPMRNAHLDNMLEAAEKISALLSTPDPPEAA